MAIKLATTTTSTTSGNESILSPKIFDHLKSKLTRPAVLPSEAANRVLASYIMARPVPKDVLRTVVRSMPWPVQIVALEVLPLKATPRANYGALCRDISTCLGETQLEGQLIYLGEGMFCMWLEPDIKPEQVYLELKKVAKSFGCEANVGVGPIAMEPRQLRSAYRSALRIAHLGKDYFGKPYRYRDADLGVLAFLAESEVQQNVAKQYASQILAGLEKPKSLLPTLRKLFEYTMSPSEAARALQVHRNTVIYRIAKIRSQTGLDVLDFNDALQLRLAVVIEDIANASGGMELAGQGNAAETGTTLSDYFMQTAFASPGIDDGVIRSWGQSMGVDLPEVFYAVLVEGILDERASSIVKNTTIIAKAELYGGRSFLLLDATPKLTRKFATEISSCGRVAWLSSENIIGNLSLALRVLEEYAVLGRLIAPNKAVVSRHDVGCYGGFLRGSGSVTATIFARSIASKLNATPQLAKTVDVLLDSSLNLTLAARRLKVHRNTLIYRIGRIKHMIGYDMTVFEEAVQVRLALLMSELT